MTIYGQLSFRPTHDESNRGLNFITRRSYITKWEAAESVNSGGDQPQYVDSGFGRVWLRGETDHPSGLPVDTSSYIVDSNTKWVTVPTFTPDYSTHYPQGGEPQYSTDKTKWSTVAYWIVTSNRNDFYFGNGDPTFFETVPFSDLEDTADGVAPYAAHSLHDFLYLISGEQLHERYSGEGLYLNFAIWSLYIPETWTAAWDAELDA
jgi:hypothetical protein